MPRVEKFITYTLHMSFMCAKILLQNKEKLSELSIQLKRLGKEQKDTTKQIRRNNIMMMTK